MCIKCYSFHEVEKNLNNYSKCPCCDVIFYSELCLIKHYSNKLNFYDVKGKVSKTPCQIFKYCCECCSIVKQYEYSSVKWRNHDCC